MPEKQSELDSLSCSRNDPQGRLARSILYLSIFSIGVGQTVVFAILAPLGREVGLVELQIGSIIAFSALVFALFSPVWGRYSDRVGRKPVLITGLLGYTFGTLLFASTFLAGLSGWLQGTTLFIALIVARSAQSLIMSGTSPSATAYLCDTTPVSARAQYMGKIGAAHSLGTILGPVLAGLAVLALLAPLYMAALLTAVAAGMAWKYLPSLPPHATQHAATTRLRFRDPRIMPFMLIGISLFTGFSVVQQTLGFYFQDVLVLDAATTAKQVGYALMGAAVSALFSQFVIVQRLRWRAVVLMRVGLTAMLVGFVGLTLFHTLPTLIASMCFVGLGIGMAMPGFSSSASVAVEPSEQGAVAGLIAACPAMGFIVGPILGAGLYQWHPYAPYGFSALMFLPLLMYALLSRRLQR